MYRCNMCSVQRIKVQKQAAGIGNDVVKVGVTQLDRLKKPQLEMTEKIAHIQKH